MNTRGLCSVNSLVQVIECVGDADRHLHPGLRGQLPNSRVALLPKGLGVVLVRQARDLPLLHANDTLFGPVCLPYFCM